MYYARAFERRAVAIQQESPSLGGIGGSGGCGGGGFGGGEDMVETRVPDTKVLGARVLPTLGRRQ